MCEAPFEVAEHGYCWYGGWTFWWLGGAEEDVLDPEQAGLEEGDG